VIFVDAAMALAQARMVAIWSIEPEDVRLARLLSDRHAALRARDLLHLATCLRRDVERIRTFDRALGAAFGRR
jgi:hypothetical protein